MKRMYDGTLEADMMRPSSLDEFAGQGDPQGHESSRRDRGDTRVPDVRARLRALLVLARGPSHLEKELTGGGGVSSQVTPVRWGDLSHDDRQRTRECALEDTREHAVGSLG